MKTIFVCEICGNSSEDRDEILACDGDAETAQLFFQIRVKLLNYNHSLHLFGKAAHQVHRDRISGHEFEERGVFEDLSGVLISYPTGYYA